MHGGIALPDRKDTALAALAVCVLLCAGCHTAKLPPFPQVHTLDCGDENWFPHSVADANGDGFPDGFREHKSQLGHVSYDALKPDSTEGPVVRIELDEPGSVNLDSKAFKLRPDTKYLLVVPVKYENLRGDGEWSSRTNGLVFYAYATRKDRHTATRMMARGTTPGWVLAMLPFDTGKKPELTDLRILLRAYRLSGTIHLKQPRIFSLPDNSDMRRHFVLPDGTVAHYNGALVPAGAHVLATDPK